MDNNLTFNASVEVELKILFRNNHCQSMDIHGYMVNAIMLKV